MVERWIGAEMRLHLGGEEKGMREKRSEGIMVSPTRSHVLRGTESSSSVQLEPMARIIPTTGHEWAVAGQAMRGHEFAGTLLVGLLRGLLLGHACVHKWELPQGS